LGLGTSHNPAKAVIEPPLPGEPPRTVCLSANYLFQRKVWAWICGGIFLFSLFVVLHDGRKVDSLARNLRQTNGSVTSRWVDRGKSTTFHIETQYLVSGVRWVAAFKVSEDRYIDLRIGDPFPIYFDATNPGNRADHAIYRDDVDRYYRNWGTGLICLILVMTAGFGIAAKAAEEQIIRLRDWHLADLVVDSVVTTSGKTGILHVNGHYVNWERRTVFVDRLLSGSTSVKMDCPIPILYDPDGKGVVALASTTFAEISRA
jgi:hypothetical protein